MTIHDELTERTDLSYWQKWARRHPEKAAEVSRKKDRSRNAAQLKRHREQERARKRAYRKLHPLPPPLSKKQKKENRKKAATNYNKKIRHEAIMAYGGYRCVCCGITEPKFLGLDHIHGGGAQHRKKIGHNNLYSWMKTHKYPAGFQVLCHNCNLAKGFYGKCPHTEATLVLAATAR